MKVRTILQRIPFVICCFVNLCGVCGQEPQVEPGLPALIEQLRAKSDVKREAAVRLLVKQGPEIIPTLIRQFDDPDKHFRNVISNLLVEEFGARCVDQLIKATQTDNVQKLSEVTGVLVRLNEKAKPAVPTLIKLSKHRDFNIRLNSIYALSGTRDPRAIPALLKLAIDQDETQHLRECALCSLALFDEALKEFLPNLIKIGTSVDPDYGEQLRSCAFGVLAQAGSLAVPELVKLIEGPLSSPTTRSCAIRCIYDMATYPGGEHAKDAVPCLIRVLGEKDSELRLGGIMALGQIGPKAKEATPALEKLLQAEDGRHRVAACRALLRIDRSHRPAMATLIQFIGKKRDVEQRCNALGTLTEFVSEAGDAVTLVITLLDDPESTIRQRACYFLADRREGRTALAKLHSLAANDPCKSVRQAAKDAVERLTKQKPPKK